MDAIGSLYRRSLVGQCKPVENRHCGVASAGVAAGASASGTIYTFKRPLPRLSESSIASNTRALSAPSIRKRSATTSSTLRAPVSGAMAFAFPLALAALEPELESDPNCAGISRSAWMRVKPLALSHCASSSALVCAGSSTGKVNTKRGLPWALACCNTSA